MSTCIITPRLPPAMDGIGDYCYQMCRHWSGSPQNFLVLDSQKESQAFWKEVKIDQFEPNKEALLNALTSMDIQAIFLQYVGYGYDLNGAPLWLPEALKEWLGIDKNRKLITMFHETWSSGTPFQKVFWYMGKQKQCVKELILLSSKIGTSCQANKNSLDILGTNKNIKIIPLGSSFQVSPTANKNWRQLLIFGKEYARLRGLRTHKTLLKHLIETKTIERIVLAGQLNSVDNDLSLQLAQELPAIEVITSYNFKSTEVPSSVVESGLALMHTQSTHMLKSTSFHLAAKLGQVCLAADSGPADTPFVQGQHYLSYKSSEELLPILSDKSKLESISTEITKVSDSYLSWPSIAKSWSALIT